MKLSFKLMTGVMLVIAALLAVHSYLVVTREVAQFRDDMDFHAYLLGAVLTSSVSDVWNSVGPERAMSIIEDANRSERLVRVRLVWLDRAASDNEAPLVNSELLGDLSEGKELLVPEYEVGGVKYHVAYFPVSVKSPRPIALELTQPFTPVYSYTMITILHKVGLFAAFLVIGGVLVWWLGIRLIGRPVKALVSQAEAVGHGNLNISNDLERSRDEIGTLAGGLNRMVVDLRVARNQLEQETAQRLEAVEQLNHAERLTTVGKLASGLAHELGTPLNVVSGRAKMISGGGMSEMEITESAEVIKQQSDRMTDLIRKLLDFARKSPQQKRPENLAHSVDQVVQMLSPLAAGRTVKIMAESNGPSPTVRIDPAQIQQVLSNIIMNGIHAMPDGGTVTVRYGVRKAKPPADHGGPSGSYACIDIIDNGTGIAEDDLSRIFLPFFSTKQVGEGTGLGLSIAHGILREHGGWITVQSELGEGSTFSVFLPLEGDE